MAKSGDARKSREQKAGGQGPSEDVKRKFREALEKKQAHAGRDVSDDSEHGKVDHAQGAATNATQQMFRRKSGG
ncbi:DUF5302 domain-containing protein [Phycicoccus sp. Soil802]|uniref:DUF5302 domain-containing protein n=1 Tax=Phycicoccus sp. Soil802 TaxID=1736414 RepID=UPI00070295F6|nr:DUF5302 domain-containing protein [Phycicoccus sp. Soil802]KRF29593.1 hypothetical protein ASG91_00790 [Phycicoccus sp. Soil802]